MHLPIRNAKGSVEGPEDSLPSTARRLVEGQYGSGMIAGTGWECDAGEEVNREALRADGHDQAVSLLVRGDQTVFIRGDGNDFGWFWHLHTIG